MDRSNDYKIKKNEKGPLQRFKNQNLMLKKFGDMGLSVYKAITGKRSLSELKNDVSVDPKLFDQMIEYMQQNDLIILEPSSSESSTEEPVPISPATDLPSKKKAPAKKKVSKEPEIPIEPEEPAPIESSSKIDEVQPEISPSFDDEIKPIDFDSDVSSSKKKKPDLEPDFTQSEPDPIPQSQPEPADLAPPQNPSSEDISPLDSTINSSPSNLGTLEQIIFDKYGDLGLKVYALIDGQRTAEEIMRQTGLTESKLVEILDFLDEQGIIKLDYPRNQTAQANQPLSPSANAFGTQNTAPNYSSYSAPQQPPSPERGFTPMLEGETKNEENSPVPSPLEVYSKAPIDIVRSVQLKAKILLKYGDKGNKIMEMLDGKNDVLDISLKLSLPIYTLYELINFMMENGLLIRRTVQRSEVKSKYGEEGYTIYKRYGKEGLLFYELVGKEIGIKAMGDMVSKDKTKVLEMFIFIYQVLGVELPVDKALLSKELS